MPTNSIVISNDREHVGFVDGDMTFYVPASEVRAFLMKQQNSQPTLKQLAEQVLRHELANGSTDSRIQTALSILEIID